MKIDKWTKEDTNAVKVLGYCFLILIFIGLSNVNGTTGATSTNQKTYVAVTPIQTPIPTPVPMVSNNYIFDIDREAGIILYKKGGCIITTMIDTDVNEESGICTGNDWDSFRKETKKIKPIVKTPMPTPVPVSTPVPTPIPTAGTDKPFENPWDFVEYVQKNWVYERDNGKVVQEPEVYFKLLSGDCDDFATMVAYYLQEIYGYDTLVATVQLPEGPHLVAFWYLEQSTIDTIAQQCGTSIPTITKNGRTYAAIDWEICTEWTWTGTGTITTYEWSYYVGKVV